MCKIKLKKHQTSAEMLIDRPSVSRSLLNKTEKLGNYILMEVGNLLCATYKTGMQLRCTKIVEVIQTFFTVNC